MNISPFFVNLRSAYLSEIHDLKYDSEGRDVLRQRLADKRKEINFLIQMMELSPEMVAVVFHQGFNFKLPAVVDHLLTHEADEFPEWSSLSDAIQLATWAQDLADVVLKNPGGEWFLTVAAGLEYMASRPGAQASAQDDDESDDNEEDEDEDQPDEFDRDEDGNDQGDGQARKEAGDDWMAAQGFDRKD